MSKSQKRWLWLVFMVVLTVYAKGKVRTSFDSGYSVHLAVSLLEEGNLDLEEYRSYIPPSDYRVIEVDGVLQSRYPVGPSVVAAPLILILGDLGKYVFFVWDLEIYIKEHRAEGIERFVGSFFAALGALVLFCVAHLRLSFARSLAVLGIFAFCTSAWSVVSRALWQHGPSIVFLSAALYVLLRARDDDPRWSRYAGLFLALAYTMRPTNSLPVLILSIYVLIHHRAQLARYLAWASVVAIPFCAYHWSIYGSVLPVYYRQGASKFTLANWGFVEGAAGNLISPGRGLFIYSPVLLFSILGAILLLRQKRWSLLDSALAAIVVLHWLVISSWKIWWGGTVFGPRLFADMLPFLVYFLIPVIEIVEPASLRGRALAVALSVTIAVSAWIHYTGATRWATWDWNIEPTSVDQEPSRMWDWHDPPFLRTTSETHPKG